MNERGKLIQEILAVILIIISTAGVFFAVSLHRKAEIKDKIEILVRAPERGNWFPNIIYAEDGKEITLLIRNVDTVSHGFYLPAFDIMIEEIKAGEVKEVKFTPDKKGEFTFFCAVWCSDNHMQMRGKLLVK